MVIAIVISKKLKPEYKFFFQIFIVKLKEKNK